MPAEQAPAPSQLEIVLAIPPLHAAAEQLIAAPGNAHATAFVPSHFPWQAPTPAHAARPARGAPVTATQLPARPGSLQAWHCPSHAVAQQTPSAQWALAH